jgi:hypothetical protein
MALKENSIFDKFLFVLQVESIESNPGQPAENSTQSGQNVDRGCHHVFH